jgi:selenocysteine lyase/cysteine desulfurase
VSAALGQSIGSRRGFTRLEPKVYLAHAAVAPLADDVVQAIVDQTLAFARQGAAAIGPAIEAAALARERFAALIGADASDVARVSSTSAGVSAVATALRLAPGERIVCFEGEFPTNVTPWRAVAQRAGALVETVPIAPFERAHAEGLALLERVLERGARVVAASAVQFQTGFALPLAAMARLAHAAGALFFVDAIQAVGAQPLDVHALGIDALAAAGHKWLMGPLGCAYLFVARAARERLEPLQVGWTSHETPDVFLFAANELAKERALEGNARVFEQGVLPFANFAASAVALETLLTLGPAAIHAHVQRWHDAFEPRAVALGLRSRRSREVAGRSNLLCFEPPAGTSAKDLVAALAREGVSASCPDGHLRIAPHWPNSLEEVEVTARALSSVVARHRREER